VNILAWSRPISRRFSLVCLVSVLLLAGPSLAYEARVQSDVQTVRLVVDYGDGVIKILDRLPWLKGNTVLDVLNAGKASTHGITFKYTGHDASAFLTEIDGVTNQGGGTGAKNWQFWVNTFYADRSFAVYAVQAADTVFWRFTTAEGAEGKGDGTAK
jgi:Domain of unknown function (DUF4430)